jgi:hypothetical protein
MAIHIESVAASSTPKFTKDQLLKCLMPGMVIFCEGEYDISKGIEAFTNSPFSHVATVLEVPSIQRLGVLEATKDHGVHIGKLDYYLDGYKGNIVLADAPALQFADITKLLQAQFDLIDDGYDIGQEVSMVAHRLISAFPVHVDKGEYFCSGLYQQGRKATSLPLKFSGPGMATPEDVWTDPSIVPICALVKG